MINNIEILSDHEYSISELYPEKNILCCYKPMGYHRNGNPLKSQWLICIDEEIETFVKSMEENWKEEYRGWWIDPSGNKRIIGETKYREAVYIVRYQGICPDGQQNNCIWHGYPADIRRKKNDIPSDIVLNDWKSKNMINQPQFSRIRRGIA